MTNPYRAMCAELLADYDNRHYRSELSDRARALLAQPEPPELTDAYLISGHDLAAGWNQQADAYNQWDSLDLYEQLAWAQSRAIAADRARYGHSTPQPKPEGLTKIALQMLGTIESMGLIIPEITDTIRKALEQGRPTPQPPADGELTVNLRMDLSSECLKRLCDGLAAAVKPNGGYRALTTDDDISGEFIGEQQVGVEWWLPEHGCDSLENTLDSIKGRLFAAVRDWLPTASQPATHWLPANALPIPEAQPTPTSPSLPKTMQHDLPENIFSIDFPPTKAQANNKGKVLWYAKGHGWYSGWFQSAYMKDTSHWTYAPDDLCIEPDTVDTIRKAFDVWVKTFPEDSFGVASEALVRLGYVAGWKRGHS